MRILNTRVTVKPLILMYAMALWGAMTWIGLQWHPGRELLAGVFIGLASTLLMLFADLGHPLGHVLSARLAGAPMDEILISGEMPRTLYRDNDVPPRVHRLRAIGGPVFNLLGLLVSLAVFALASRGTLTREWAGWSSVAHGLMLIMSLSPLPMVDGGTILKWTLVETGKTATQADAVLRRANSVIGIAAAVAGLALLAFQATAAGLILLGAGVVVIGFGARQ